VKKERLHTEEAAKLAQGCSFLVLPGIGEDEEKERLHSVKKKSLHTEEAAKRAQGCSFLVLPGVGEDEEKERLHARIENINFEFHHGRNHYAAER